VKGSVANAPTEVRVLAQAEADVPPGDRWLSTREAAVLRDMRFEARRRDWRLGRWTAKAAVRAWLRMEGVADVREVEILAAPDGAPEAFLSGVTAGVTLSISHRAGHALAAVGPPGLALGCDLEAVEPRSPAFVRDYFTEAERAAVESAPADARAALANLLWAAKEAALKARRTGLREDTRSVEVEAPAAPPGGEWTPITVRQAAGGRALFGWWSYADHWVRAVITDQPTPPPHDPAAAG